MQVSTVVLKLYDNPVQFFFGMDVFIGMPGLSLEPFVKRGLHNAYDN